MHNEFESMENYWGKKMEEERTFYEEQLKVRESQFKELELKMREYEELLESFELSKPTSNTQGLYMIDEQRYLEEQVNEWETEISQLRIDAAEMEAAHDKEIFELKYNCYRKNTFWKKIKKSLKTHSF